MKRRATDITDEIRAHVAGGWLGEGEWLGAERDLVNSFQASRATVREALRILEAEGYVTVRRGPGGGVFVRRPTPDDLVGHLSAHFDLAGATRLEIAAAASLLEALEAGHDCNRALSVLGQALAQLGGVPCRPQEVAWRHLAPDS